MNATNVLRQKQRVNGQNGLRVPYPSQFSNRYNDLFLTLGTTRFIDRFEAAETTTDLLLRVWLREGEIANLVVIERLKNLFRKFKKVSFAIDLQQCPIEIKINK